MSPDTIGCMRELLKMYSKSTKADLISESAIESDNFVKSAENIKNNICRKYKLWKSFYYYRLRYRFLG